jgi:hypothetical protein
MRGFADIVPSLVLAYFAAGMLLMAVVFQLSERERSLGWVEVGDIDRPVLVAVLLRSAIWPVLVVRAAVQGAAR